MSRALSPQTVSFIVPGKPRPKGRPRATSVNGRAHVYTPRGTVNYEALVAMTGRAAMGADRLIDGGVDISIVIGLRPPPSASSRVKSEMLQGRLLPTKRPDVDNVAKAIVDALNGIVFRDDRNIIKLVVEKRYAPEDGVEVVVAARACAD